MSGRTTKKSIISALALGISLAAFAPAYAADTAAVTPAAPAATTTNTGNNTGTAPDITKMKEQLKVRHDEILKRAEADYQNRVRAIEAKYAETLKHIEEHKTMPQNMDMQGGNAQGGGMGGQMNGNGADTVSSNSEAIDSSKEGAQGASTRWNASSNE
ncbi:MAG: hypothetical protein K0R98_917 [Rickettsiaceae bacterium]|jgi:hypothetical protein|nr:hypothetical protein [Rickettsiaceae bacterium]